EGIRLGRRIGDLLHLFHAVHLEAEMVDAPGMARRADERDIDEAVGEIDRPVLAPLLFLHAENLFIIRGGFLPVLHIDGDVADARLFHGNALLILTAVLPFPESFSTQTRRNAPHLLTTNRVWSARKTLRPESYATRAPARGDSPSASRPRAGFFPARTAKDRRPTFRAAA